jgi:hypothetical protein
MTVLYFIYQWLIFMPLFLVLSIITALITIVGTALTVSDHMADLPAMLLTPLAPVFPFPAHASPSIQLSTSVFH